jgi:predicted flap endonuclease-1-like 5' DNA nuclease
MKAEQRNNADRSLLRSGSSSSRGAGLPGNISGTAQPNADFPKGIGAPATRALLATGYSEFRQLADVPASELKRLHGMGPKALARLQEALEQQGMSLG